MAFFVSTQGLMSDVRRQTSDFEPKADASNWRLELRVAGPLKIKAPGSNLSARPLR